jgi:hypothetical protein
MTIDEAIKRLEELRQEYGGGLEFRHFSGEFGYPEREARIEVYHERPGRQGPVKCAYVCGA